MSVLAPRLCPLIRWFISPTSVPSGRDGVLTHRGVIRDPSRCPRGPCSLPSSPRAGLTGSGQASDQRELPGGGVVTADVAARSGAERGVRFARGKCLAPARA